ncbi:MAG TPA: PilZ domain-containing protein [Acidiferrobacterales bacterium]|nr:PilZ domain-containing protein [Acidiferrobacterales bacterium]
MRSFIRHPTDIPIEICLADQARQQEPLRNVSCSGLSFRHPEAAPVGSNIVVRIALTVPPFEASCRVTWCQADGNAWQVGVEFLDQDDLFRVRMVEQICHIELYRRTVRESEGRALSSHEAALEWIERYADAFPFSDSNSDRPQDKQK